MSGRGDIVVVGGGPWGLASARELATSGWTVTLLDDERPSAGSFAAGMLGPWTEAEPGRDALFALLMTAAAEWPDFARALGPTRCGYAECGTLLAAASREDVAALRHQLDRVAARGADAAWLGASAIRDLEPALGTAVVGGAFLPDEHQVDPRRLIRALRDACVAAGVTFLPSPATTLLREGETVVGVEDGDGHAHRGTVVLAAGWRSHEIASGVPLRGVKGQILRLRTPAGSAFSLERVVRSPGVYVVPRASGEVIVGATQEERTDDDVLAGDVHTLLDDALRLVPELRHFVLEESSAGVRPASDDGLPVIGRAADGVVWATGGFRHGVLMTPVVGAAIARAAAGEPEPLAGFGPERFTRAAAPARIRA